MSSTRTPRRDAVGPETEDRMHWYGVMAAFLQDDTRLIDLEGAFRSSKTTACLRKVAKSCLRYPGIHWWLNRYSDGDTQRQLKPQWILMMQRMGIVPEWDAAAQAYVLENGSKGSSASRRRTSSRGIPRFAA